jgi:ribonuclease VapC
VTLVIDSSALISIVLREPDWLPFFEAIVAADTSYLSCMNLHETRIVVFGRLAGPGIEKLDELIASQTIAFANFDPVQARLAFEAHANFGKGRHPARLNLADCAAYALAKSLDAPLLYKGDDFRLTDIRSAL